MRGAGPIGNLGVGEEPKATVPGIDPDSDISLEALDEGMNTAADQLFSEQENRAFDLS
ncbi:MULTISPECIES: hypothetical protein [Parafrankia]|uniref:hypothetical protein n=1 Tax=Parafrankia TaxID=2994362 RepID=UPI0013F4DC02|nr:MULTISPECIES: hypothetical protein [Parafrankia]